MEQHIENQLLNAARVMEEQVDNELQALEKMNDDDLENLRRQRLESMKKSIRDKEELLSKGHGKYYEISNEKEFFDESKRSKNLVCHIYRDGTFRCEIVDKHLALLAAKHIECKFIKLNAEKAPFLTQRLKIRVIPTMVLVKDEKTKDYIVGFDDLGGHDEFSTKMLEWRIAHAGVIEYNGDLLTPPDSRPKKNILAPNRKKGAIRGRGDDSSDDNDW